MAVCDIFAIWQSYLLSDIKYVYSDMGVDVVHMHAHIHTYIHSNEYIHTHPSLCLATCEP